jgi:hypothetical protein
MSECVGVCVFVSVGMCVMCMSVSVPVSLCVYAVLQKKKKKTEEKRIAVMS